MNGKIKIYSKAIMLNQTLKTAAIIFISAVLVLLSNNLFIGGQYLFGLFENEAFSNVIFHIIFFLTAFISVCLTLPLKFGREIWFFESAKNNTQKIRSVFMFYKPKYFFKSTALAISLFFIKLFWLTFFLLPGIAFSAYLYYSLQNGITKAMLILVGSSIALTLLCGLFFSFAAFQRYSLSYLLLYENEHSSIRDAISTSKMLMDKNCFGLARLKLSFCLWILSCVLVFPVIYVYPYYKTTVSYYLRKILTSE